jgi:hypothetical protein
LVYIPYEGTPSAFLFRSITLQEWDRIKLCLDINDPVLIDTTAAQTMQACLLWPEGFDLEDLSIGDFKRLYAKLTEASPFGSIDNFLSALERYRTKHQDLVNLIHAFITAAFPGMRRHEIAQFTAHEVFQHLVTAETILQRKFEIQGAGPRKPPTPVSPDEVRVLQAQKAMERREVAIAAARDRRRRALETRAGEHAASFGAASEMAPPRQAPIPIPAATLPQSSRVERVGATSALLHRYPTSEILKPTDDLIDYERERSTIDRILHEDTGG